MLLLILGGNGVRVVYSRSHMCFCVSCLATASSRNASWRPVVSTDTAEALGQLRLKWEMQQRVALSSAIVAILKNGIVLMWKRCRWQRDALKLENSLWHSNGAPGCRSWEEQFLWCPIFLLITPQSIRIWVANIHACLVSAERLHLLSSLSVKNFHFFNPLKKNSDRFSSQG